MSNAILAKSGWNDSKKMFDNTEKWLQLTNPVGSQNGLILFKDNGNDTATLTGTFLRGAYDANKITLAPPEGYKFTSDAYVMQEAHSGPNTINFNGALDGLSLKITASSGNLVFPETSKYDGSNMVIFQKAFNNETGALYDVTYDLSSPTTVSISKI